MSIRFSNACLATLSVASFLVLLPASPVASQERLPLPLDIVEETVRLVRIAALSLDDPRDRGRAFAGLVAGHLRRGLLRKARREMRNIKDPLWRARAHVHIADYQRRKGRNKSARAELRRAIKTMPSRRKEAAVDETWRLIAERQAEMQDFAAALRTAGRLGTPLARIELMLRIADKWRRDPDTKIAAGAAKAYAEALRRLKEGRIEVAVRGRLLLRIAKAQIAIGKTDDARKTLDRLRALLAKASFAGRDTAIAELAAAYISTGNRNRAMTIVRTISDDANRALAMAYVAGAIGRNGDIDAAVPLFNLALEDAKGLPRAGDRARVLTHLVREQASAGRNADAFATAGWIRDREKQARALLAMGEVLIGKGQYDEALKLGDYIPYIGMRARILAATALIRGHAGDRAAASALLAKALEDTGVDVPPIELDQGLKRVIEVQMAVGNPEAAKALFERAETLADRLREPQQRIGILTQLARAFAKLGQVEAADVALSSAWRLTWKNKKAPFFADALAEIVAAQLAMDRLLQAFDTAARVPEPSREEIAEAIKGSGVPAIELPKYRALRMVALTATRLGKNKIAMRAARQITNQTARADALTDIAITVGELAPDA